MGNDRREGYYMLFNYKCEVRYSLGNDFMNNRIIHVIDSIANVKSLLMKLAGTDGTSIAFLEIEGQTTYTISYNGYFHRFTASHFNGLQNHIRILRDFWRDEALKQWERKQERRRTGAEKFANMRK